jgi:hypothetical protein
MPAHFFYRKMSFGVQASYATEAGTAQKATYADRAGETVRSDQAKYADIAQQANYSMVAKEAERLNCAGDMIYIDSTNHYVIMFQQNQDPSKGIIFDLANNLILNVASVEKPVKVTHEVGNALLAFSAFGAQKLQDRIDALEQRISLLEN